MNFPRNLLFSNTKTLVFFLIFSAGLLPVKAGGGGPTFFLGHFSILKYVIALENSFQTSFE